MGQFLAVSAFQSHGVQAVADATIAYASRFSCTCDVESGEPSDSWDALVFAPANDWTTVFWPNYFNIHDIELCRDVSVSLATLASTIHVYHGNYWTHALFDAGAIRDLFASMPYYFAESEEDASRLASKWAGNPRAVAELLGATPEAIAPYYVHLPSDGSPLDRKVFDDDRFSLDEFWVFTDFWRRLGIQYPDQATPELVLRFDRKFGRMLPTSDEFEL